MSKRGATKKQKTTAAAKKSEKKKEEEEKRKEEKVFTKDLASALLTFDSLCRREGRWPLLDEEDMQWAEKERERQGMPRRFQRFEVPVVVDYVKSFEKDACNMSSEHMHQSLCKQYPLLMALFERAPNSLLVAGGAVVDIIRGERSRNVDVDIFFYGITVDEANALLKSFGDVFGKDFEHLTRCKPHLEFPVTKSD